MQDGETELGYWAAYGAVEDNYWGDVTPKDYVKPCIWTHCIEAPAVV